MFRLALVLFAVASLRAGPAHAQPRIRTIARVIATGDVDGRFASPICHQGQTLVPSDRSAFTYALMRHANDEDQPMVIDTGGLLAPHGVARFSAAQNPEALADMVQQLGYRALALGLNDLGAPRDSTTAVIEQLRQRNRIWAPRSASPLACASGIWAAPSGLERRGRLSATGRARSATRQNGQTTSPPRGGTRI